MRVSNEEKQKSRRRILEAASRRFRKGGIAETGLSDIMKDAGMTHGGFYKHFEDKDALVRAALADAFDSFTRPLAEAADSAAIDDFRDRYLSEAHRDGAERGCPVAALAPEVARSGSDARRVMSGGVEAMVAQLQRRPSDPANPRAAALRDLAALVGAVVIARAVDEPLSTEVLTAVRNEARGDRGARGTGDTRSLTGRRPRR